MNWIGGSRFRFKENPLKRKQDEYFKKKKIEHILKKNDKDEINLAQSQDLLFIKTADFLSLSKQRKNLNKKINRVDMSLPKMDKILGPQLPMSPIKNKSILRLTPSPEPFNGYDKEAPNLNSEIQNSSFPFDSKSEDNSWSPMPFGMFDSDTVINQKLGDHSLSYLNDYQFALKPFNLRSTKKESNFRVRRKLTYPRSPSQDNIERSRSFSKRLIQIPEFLDDKPFLQNCMVDLESSPDLNETKERITLDKSIQCSLNMPSYSRATQYELSSFHMCDEETQCPTICEENETDASIDWIDSQNVLMCDEETQCPASGEEKETNTSIV